jgi:hypothetical protein
LNGYDFQSAIQKIRASGAVAWVAIALAAGAAVVTGWQLFMLAVAVFTPTPRPLADPGKTTKQIEQYTAMLDSSVKQADGRTLFILPVNPKSVAEQAKEPVAEEPKEPPAPTSYGGPGVIAMMNGLVWFDNGTQLEVGEEANGVGVVAISAPWDSRLRWRGVEFTVPLFEKDRVVAPKSRSAAEEKLGGLAATPVAKPADSAKSPDQSPEKSPEKPPEHPPEHAPDPKPSTNPEPKATETPPAVPPPAEPAPAKPGTSDPPKPQ